MSVRWHEGLPDTWREAPRYPPICRRVRGVTIDRLDSGVVIRSMDNEKAYVHAEETVSLDAAQ